MRTEEKEMEDYFDRLWPICRSITGNGLRDSFRILQEVIPLQLEEVPTGTPVFDWQIPREWNIRDAFIITPDGRKICDFRKNNLNVLNYAVPVNREVDFSELKDHLFYLESFPEAVPYTTSYYKENWGFCLSWNEFKTLPTEGKYKVFIDSTLEPGSLTYGHLVLKGSTDREVLLSTYLCHPSMANNELSGPLVMAYLYRRIAALPNRKYTYRFVLAPETIGVIAYLHKYGAHMKKHTDAGYVLTCCGNEAPFVYKMSKRENSIADSVAKHILRFLDHPHEIIPFAVGGSDERQYCSPGFNMPVGSLTRSMYQRYREYHTSLDNKDFISFSALRQTVEVYFQFIMALELNDKYKSAVQYCEPQLGKRGLYPHSASPDLDRRALHRMLHLLSFADGETELLTIAEKRNESMLEYAGIVEHLRSGGLLSV